MDSFISFKPRMHSHYSFLLFTEDYPQREITHFYLMVSTAFSVENVDEIT